MSWGSNGEGELGIGTRITGWTPAEVTGLDRLVAIDAGGAARGSSGVVRNDGTVWMWGHDGWGQIGVGTSGGYQARPMKVTSITNVAAIYLGGPHSFAVRADGTFWIWGFGYRGRGLLGKDLHVPTRLDLP